MMLMPLLIALLQASQPSPQALELARTTIVVLNRGDITIATPTRAFRITSDGRNRSVVKSPDGKLIAFIHQDVPPANEADAGQTSLRIAEIGTGEIRQAFAPKPAQEPEHDMRAFDNPRWSLDGGFIYVDAVAWTTSPAVHQIRLATGQERYVIDGSLFGIIRQGPYRGYLLIRRHRYRRDNGGGSFDPVYLVRPDGAVIFQIDGSAEDGGDRSVPKWLFDNGWSAT